MFKCLVFGQGLTASHDKDFRSRIFNKMEQDVGITLQKINVEFQRILDIKNDNFTIEEKDISRVQGVRPKLKSAKDDIKPYPCYGCSGLHFKEDCYFKNKKRIFRMVFWATKVFTAEGKISIWKDRYFQN